VTTPSPTPDLRETLAHRDPSLALAVAALLQVADAGGAAAFEDVAVAFREVYVRLQATTRGTGAAVLESADVLAKLDEARAHLSTSVLPRLGQMGMVYHPAGAPTTWAGGMVGFTPPVWETLSGRREAARLEAEQAATEAVLRAESTSGEVRRPAGGSLLEAQDLIKSFKGRRVVDQVSVRVEQGEIVGLLGPNGAGKTTTFYMITGLMQADAGRIAIDGRDITSQPMFMRARMGIGYLSQEPSVFRKLTVEENLLAILETLPEIDGRRGERLEQLLDELGLRHLRRQKAYQLSGGERRRLEITRALVTNPKFMLLDEPFAGVDPIAVHDIQTIVADLRRRGIGVLITDHNVEQTLDIVDRAYIMFEGKVQVSGTVRELVFDDRVADRYLGPTLTKRLRDRLGAAA
jgi:lipopolysaccharide export system ATP-binding protein